MERIAKQFSDVELGLLSDRFKILAEPSRLKILRCLFHSEKNVSEIIAETGMLQANVSKQLQILLKNKVLQRRKDGLQHFYFVSDPTVHQICEMICKG